MAKTAINPLADMVLATVDKAQTKTASGIYLPENAQAKPSTATVQSVGPDVKSIKAGDKIIYENFGGTDVKHDNVDYVLVKEDKILAKVA